MQENNVIRPIHYKLLTTQNIKQKMTRKLSSKYIEMRHRKAVDHELENLKLTVFRQWRFDPRPRQKESLGGWEPAVRLMGCLTAILEYRGSEHISACNGRRDILVNSPILRIRNSIIIDIFNICKTDNENYLLYSCLVPVRIFLNGSNSVWNY